MAFTLEESFCSNGAFKHHIDEEVTCALTSIYKKQDLRDDTTIWFNRDSAQTNGELILQLADFEIKLHEYIKNSQWLKLIPIIIITTRVQFDDEIRSYRSPNPITWIGVYNLQGQIIKITVESTDDEEFLKEYSEE